MKTFSYLALVTAQHQRNTAQLALGGNRASKKFINKIKQYIENLHSKLIVNFCVMVKTPLATTHWTTLTPPPTSPFFTTTLFPRVEKIPSINHVYDKTPEPLVTQVNVFANVPSGDATCVMCGISSPEIIKIFWNLTANLKWMPIWNQCANLKLIPIWNQCANLKPMGF